MQNSIYKCNYFNISELGENISLIKVSLQYLVESNVIFIIDSLFFLADRGYRNLIIDISETEYLERASFANLENVIKELSEIEIKTKFIVSKDKPRFNYSVGNPIPNTDFYLSMGSALKDIVN